MIFMAIVYLGGVIGVLWLLVLSFLIYKLRRHYSSLLTRTRKTSIDEILDTLLEHDERFTSEMVAVKKIIDDTINKSRKYYQKIGFVRFNPFERVSGDQSFVIALLDGDESGMLLNFLYTREGIRVYAKPVKEGKSVGYELSTEENEAVKKAQ